MATNERQIRSALLLGAACVLWLFVAAGGAAAASHSVGTASAKAHRGTGTAAGHWRVDAARSTLGFATVKNVAVGEGHQFSRLSGDISASGLASLNVDLASVDTGIEIRDQRIRELLFEVARFPQARVETQVNMADVLKLAPGQSVLIPLELRLRVREVETTLSTMVRAERLSATRVQVSTIRPVIVNTDALGLTEGVERLRNIAGLQAISPVVPVSLLLSLRLEH